MKCPHCGLINPDTSQRCDCGYDFEKKTVVKQEPPTSADESKKFLDGNKIEDTKKKPSRLRMLLHFGVVSA